MEFLHRGGHQAVRFEEQAKRQVVDTGFKGDCNQANYEFNLREARSESSVQCLTTQPRQQDAELYSTSQDCERSRQEQQYLPIAGFSRICTVVLALKFGS